MPTTKPVTRPTISPWQEMLMKELILGGNVRGLDLGPQDFSQGMGQSQQNLQALSLAGLENIAMGNVPGTGTLAQGDQALSGIIGRGPTDLSSFIESNIVNPTTRDFNERILPGIRSTGTGQGVRFSQGGSARERLAGADATERIARARSSAVLQGRQMDDQTLIQSILAASGIRGDFTKNLLGAQAGGLQPQILGEESRQNAIRSALMLALQGTQGLGSQSSPDAIDWVSSILGGASSGVGAGIGAVAALCHGAAAHFGWFTPKWWAARHWILYGWPLVSKHGIGFRELYIKFSPIVGYLIEHNEGVRAGTLPFFNWCADMGADHA